MVQSTNIAIKEVGINNQFPIQYLDTDIVLPFYFDHHRISPNVKLNLALFKSQLTTCITTFVNNFNKFNSH